MNRLESGQYISSSKVIVSDIPSYENQLVWSSPETATTNTDAILAMTSYTSTACSHCRSKTFTIEGVTYAGQLPNLNELSQIFANRTIINTNDPTASTYSSLVVPTSKNTWSSTQCDKSTSWGISSGGGASVVSKTINWFVIPVLEIPLED